MIVLCVCLRIAMSSTYCNMVGVLKEVGTAYPSRIPGTQCCQFLWIIHSWFTLRFSLTLIYRNIVSHNIRIQVCNLFLLDMYNVKECVLTSIMVNDCRKPYKLLDLKKGYYIFYFYWIFPQIVHVSTDSNISFMLLCLKIEVCCMHRHTGLKTDFLVSWIT